MRWQITRKQENAAYEHIVSHEHTGENTSLTCVNNNSRLFIIQLVYSVALQVYIFSKQKQDCSQVFPRNILQPLSLFLAEFCVTVVSIPINGFILQGCRGSRQVEETVVMSGNLVHVSVPNQDFQVPRFQDYYVLDNLAYNLVGLQGRATQGI